MSSNSDSANPGSDPDSMASGMRGIIAAIVNSRQDFPFLSEKGEMALANAQTIVDDEGDHDKATILRVREDLVAAHMECTRPALEATKKEIEEFLVKLDGYLAAIAEEEEAEAAGEMKKGEGEAKEAEEMQKEAEKEQTNGEKAKAQDE